MSSHYGYRSCDILAQQSCELLEQLVSEYSRFVEEQHTSGYSMFVEERQCISERLERQPVMIFKLV